MLRDALGEIGIEGMRTEFFMTHFHLDHAGLIERVAAPESTIYVNKVELDRVEHKDEAKTFERICNELIKEGVADSEASGYARLSIEQKLFNPETYTITPVKEGDCIRVGTQEFSVVETPGHTLGHHCLFHPESRILFTGDHILFIISPSLAIFPEGGDSFQAYIDSLNKVKQLECSNMLIAHGESRSDFAQRIDWLETHLIDRLDETEGIIGADPGLTGEEIIRKITWNVPFSTWEEISIFQRWCIIAEGIAILNHLILNKRITREADANGLNRYYLSPSTSPGTPSKESTL